MPPSMTDPAPIDLLLLQHRRERVYLVLAGLFLGTLAMLNILGISRFIVFGSYSPGEGGWAWGRWGTYSFAVAVGVLPYPLTFLCTDLISEFYGRRRANAVVWVGLLVNLWVIFVLWLGGVLPMRPELQPYAPGVVAPPLPAPVLDAAGQFVTWDDQWTFYRLRALAFGAVTASMIAYLLAQFIDVQLFHFWKRLTNGRHLWLRNNASTLVSQLVDTTAVIAITHFYARALPIDPAREIWPQLWLFVSTSYAFKAIAALLDTAGDLRGLGGAQAVPRH